MSFDKYKTIYMFYNNWFEIPNHFKDLNPIIKLCNMHFRDEEELKIAIKDLMKKDYQEHDGLSEIQNELSFYYAHSLGLSLIRLQNNLACLEEEAFEKMGLGRKSILQLTVAIVFYYLLVNVPNVEEKLTRQQACDYFSDGVTFDYTLLKKICWEIDESDFQKYMQLFAFDMSKMIGDKVVHEQLFNLGNRYIVFDMREFVRHIIHRFEMIVCECLPPLAIEKYRTKKGEHFEEEVYDLMSMAYPQTKRNLYYYFGEARCEIDLVIENKESLLVGECKSGTVDLKYDFDEKQILGTVYKKAKKAIHTLNRFNDFYNSSENYVFVKGNSEVVLKGKCEKQLILLHITMDAFETLAPNLNTFLPSMGETDAIILTISYEHLLTILLDCKKRGLSLIDYLLKRQSVKRRYPKLALEINELDLYAVMTDKYGPSSLNELLNNNSFEEFPNLEKAIASFHNMDGDEISPANDMIDKVDNYILSGYIPQAKNIAGINKRYIRLLHCVLDVQEKNDHSIREVP